MRIGTRIAAAALLAAGFVAASANADHRYPPAFKYEITITNVTKGQVFSPPVLVTHSRDISLFSVGEAALRELAIVAEDGAGGPLVDLLSTLPQVFEAQATSAPLAPGASAVYEIKSSRPFAVFSIVSMLVNTNDAFFAIDSEALPRSRWGLRTHYALGYDAGSEGNNEDCRFVPGPACPMDSGNARSPDDAEGFVHIHNGVHGIADLAADAYDWRNPVAKVSVRRTR